jgi:hypothetical protein
MHNAESFNRITDYYIQHKVNIEAADIYSSGITCDAGDTKKENPPQFTSNRYS